MQAGPLIEWPEPIFQLIDFIGLFLASGAVGFRYSALRGRLATRAGAGATRSLFDDSARQAAVLGAI
ncbi:MAG TPA: hypothetical protein VHM30_13920, partial [Gemmatimonadaceae bacterium]|nr:hypothetical protein [Gemmatimonadaceae bacterium]